MGTESWDSSLSWSISLLGASNGETVYEIHELAIVSQPVKDGTMLLSLVNKRV